MQFDNLADFIDMAGHGKFVWMAYVIGFLVVFYLVWTPLARKKKFFTDQALRYRREQRAQKLAGAEAESSE